MCSIMQVPGGGACSRLAFTAESGFKYLFFGKSCDCQLPCAFGDESCMEIEDGASSARHDGLLLEQSGRPRLPAPLSAGN